MNVQAVESVKVSGIARTIPTALPPRDTVIHSFAAEDQVLLNRLLSEPVDYINHPDFKNKTIEKRLFSGPAKLAGRTATRFLECADPITDAIKAGERVPALSYAQESHLFMRYNLGRKRIADILAEFAGKPLSATATRNLLAWGHRVLSSRSVLVRLNMPLVLAMAKRTRLTSIDFNEMVSEGDMALLRSVEKFDCSRGFKFSTYSCRAILKSFSRVAMRASRYRGRFPTEFDPSMERSDHIDTQRLNVEQDCVDEIKEILLENLAELSDVERTVINERFAIGVSTELDERCPKTLEQVGRIIGVTKERVRQIQNKALLKIRGTLEEKYLAA